MIDSYYRNACQRRIIDPFAIWCARRNLSPNQLTFLAAFFGVVAAIFVSMDHSMFALACLLVSGLCDAADGTLARLLQISSNRGSVLDIAGDRFVEASMVLGLYCYAPHERGLTCLVLLASFYLCVTTFLLSGIFEKNISSKSFHYSPGLIERSETFIFFAVVILADDLFLWLAPVFSALVFFTAIKRLTELYKLLASNSSNHHDRSRKQFKKPSMMVIQPPRIKRAHAQKPKTN